MGQHAVVGLFPKFKGTTDPITGPGPGRRPPAKPTIQADMWAVPSLPGPLKPVSAEASLPLFQFRTPFLKTSQTQGNKCLNTQTPLLYSLGNETQDGVAVGSFTESAQGDSCTVGASVQEVPLPFTALCHLVPRQSQHSKVGNRPLLFSSPRTTCQTGQPPLFLTLHPS